MLLLNIFKRITFPSLERRKHSESRKAPLSHNYIPTRFQCWIFASISKMSVFLFVADQCNFSSWIHVVFVCVACENTWFCRSNKKKKYKARLQMKVVSLSRVIINLFYAQTFERLPTSPTHSHHITIFWTWSCSRTIIWSCNFIYTKNHKNE